MTPTSPLFWNLRDRLVAPYLWMASPEDAMPLSDGELLKQFLGPGARGPNVAQAVAQAFEELIARHGPMVLGVCRRVLRCPHDADDAFQAAFLLLARNARKIRKQNSVASWLHGTAYRVAVRLRKSVELRREKEREMSETPNHVPRSDPPGNHLGDRLGDPLALVVWRELRPVLDEELSSLPEKYRTPLVLCYLQGKTNEQAAKELGWPIGSMSKRLARGRELLRERLARRGLALSAGVLFGAIGTHSASAAVPPALAAATAQAAVFDVAGHATASATVLALVEGMGKTMFATKLQTAAAVLLGIALLAGGAGLSYHVLAGEEPVATGSAPRLVPQRAGPFARTAQADKPKDPLQAKIDEAVKRGVQFLKSQQRHDDWEHMGFGIGRYQGGMTALAMLALLEAGEKPDDAAIAAGLDQLRKVAPHDTYVVGLQTAVFARAYAGTARGALEKKLQDAEARLASIEQPRGEDAVSAWEHRSAVFQRERVKHEVDKIRKEELLHQAEVDRLNFELQQLAESEKPAIGDDAQKLRERTAQHAAHLDAEKYLVFIKRNADWLLQSRRYENGQLIGWGYQLPPGGLPGADNSNTQYAILGLHAAAQAGVKIDAKVWDEVRDLYLRTQTADGGWAYRSQGGPSTITMTSAGVIGLAITREHIDRKHRNYKNAETAKQLDNALKHLGNVFTVDGRQWRYYNLYGLSRAGRTAEKKQLGANDWYKDGAEFLLRQQDAGGGWKSEQSILDGNPVIATSFAILFLTNKPK